jgi:hypothetical protein
MDRIDRRLAMEAFVRDIWAAGCVQRDRRIVMSKMSLLIRI